MGRRDAKREKKESGVGQKEELERMAQIALQSLAFPQRSNKISRRPQNLLRQFLQRLLDRLDRVRPLRRVLSEKTLL